MRSWKELMLMLVCIGGLFSLGVSQLEKGSAAWKRQICADNLKAVVRAAAMYQNDHDGAIQPVIVRTRPRWTYWYAFILKYVDNPRIFYCPAHPRAERLTEDHSNDLIPAVFDSGSLSYGMNFALSSNDDPNERPRPANIKMIADPSYTIYFGDCKMPNPTLRPTKWCWNQDYAPIHENASNFVFIDGHVETMNKDNLGLIHAFDGWTRDEKRWTNWK